MPQEIRLRDVPKDRMQKVEKMKSIFRVKTVPAVIEKLIDRYQGDQEAIKQLQQRNSQLHTAIKKYYDKEDSSRVVLYQFIKMAEAVAKNATVDSRNAKRLMKHFIKRK